MRVAVTRTGGFAGMVCHAELDSVEHPAVARIIDQMGIDLGALPEPKREPDRFVYEIEIDDHRAQVGEADLRGPLRELVDQVMTLGR